MVAAKPDCVGQRFGMLTVVGRGGVRHDSRPRPGRKSPRSRRLWLLRCDCGETIELCRGDFDRVNGGQKSCGCLGRNRKDRVDNKRRPRDITGQRFGALVAIELTGRKCQNQPTWLLKCDCGGSVEMSAKRLGLGYRLNCGSLEHQPGVHYPPTPNPYPPYAAEIVARYLHLAQHDREYINQAIEDEKINRLIRAAWIIEYRTRQGETFTELHERRFIYKHIRFAKCRIYEQRKVETGKDSRYTFSRYKNTIGSVMTNSTSFFEAVKGEPETQPESLLSVKPTKRIKFKRC